MKKLLNRKDEHTNLRLLIVLIVIIFISLFSFTQYIYIKNIKELKSSIYIINPAFGNIMEANEVPFTLAERKIEYIHQVKQFLYSFYTFDKNTFLDNTDKAKYLIDNESFEREIDKYRNEDVYNKLQNNDIISNITNPKVTINMEVYPPTGQFTFIQTLRSPHKKAKSERKIQGTFKIEDTQNRSLDNPHACILLDYRITKNEILK